MSDKTMDEFNEWFQGEIEQGSVHTYNSAEAAWAAAKEKYSPSPDSAGGAEAVVYQRKMKEDAGSWFNISKELYAERNEAWASDIYDHRALFTHPPKPAPLLTVICLDEWEPCTPEWVTRHGGCGNAPRVWCESDMNHYHPKSWPAPLPREVEEFIDAHKYTAMIAYPEAKDSTDCVSVDDLRTWMAGHVRMPVEAIRATWAAAPNVVEPPQVQGRFASEMFWTGVYTYQAALAALLPQGASDE